MSSNMSKTFKTNLDITDFKINFEDKFFKSSFHQQKQNVKLICDMDEKFDPDKFRCLCCNNVLIGTEALLELEKICENKCHIYIYLDSVTNKVGKKYFKDTFQNKDMMKEYYIFVTKKSYEDFIKSFEVKNNLRKLIEHKSFQDLIQKKEKQYVFSKIPFLSNKFNQIEKENQLQILKILSTCNYRKNKNFTEFLKLQIKEVIFINYSLQVMKMIAKNISLCKKSKKRRL